MTVDEMVARSRIEQGLPPVVQDPTTVQRIATILAAEPARQPTKEARRGGGDRLA